MQNTKAQSDVTQGFTQSNQFSSLPDSPSLYSQLIQSQNSKRFEETSASSLHWIKQREPLIYIKVKWKTMSRTILHKRRHVFPVSRTVPFTASQHPRHCRVRGCESSLLSTIPDESRNRGRNNRFSSERTLKGANEIAERFSFYREWNIFGFACHACGNSMEFEWRSWMQKKRLAIPRAPFAPFDIVECMWMGY